MKNNIKGKQEAIIEEVNKWLAKMPDAVKDYAASLWDLRETYNRLARLRGLRSSLVNKKIERFLKISQWAAAARRNADNAERVARIKAYIALLTAMRATTPELFSELIGGKPK